MGRMLKLSAAGIRQCRARHLPDSGDELEGSCCRWGRWIAMVACLAWRGCAVARIRGRTADAFIWYHRKSKPWPESEETYHHGYEPLDREERIRTIKGGAGSYGRLTGEFCRQAPLPLSSKNWRQALVLSLFPPRTLDLCFIDPPFSGLSSSPRTLLSTRARVSFNGGTGSGTCLQRRRRRQQRPIAPRRVFSGARWHPSEAEASASPAVAAPHPCRRQFPAPPPSPLATSAAIGLYTRHFSINRVFLSIFWNCGINLLASLRVPTRLFSMDVGF